MDHAQPVHALTAGLWREVAGARGNVAVSPYSVAVALAMTANGARGRTLDEMLAVLGAPDADALNAGLGVLSEHLASFADVELRSASTLFGERGVAWERDFLAALERGYAAGLQVVDFATATEAARTTINDWTAERTRGRIDDLVPQGVLDQLTRLVLVNALYLKAAWADQFQREATRPGGFRLADGATVEVPMMRSVEARLLGSGDGWQATRLDYEGGRLAMTLVLPDEGRMAELEERVGRGELPEILGAVQHQQVDLTLPRWTIRSAASLAPALSRLGMGTAFGGDADFTGMTTSEQIFIGAVLHQVFVAVDEDGTEAAAATAVAMRATAMPPPPVPVVVDRPFLFVVHDVEHRAPLFVGRVADPRERAH